MTRHRTLTVIVDVRPGSEDSLRRVLEDFGGSIQEPACPAGFACSERIHFARWVMLEPSASPPGRPWQLAFCVSFDDIPLEAQLQEVVRVAAAALDQVYGHCDGYPGPSGPEEYLRAHAIDANAVFVGAPDRTLRQIRDEARLRSAIEGFLNSHDLTGRRATEVVEAIRKFVSAEPALHWSLQPAPARRRTRLRMILFVLGVFVLLPWIAIWLLLLRFRHERFEQPDDLMPSGIDPGLLRELERIEDLHLQNQFSQLMVVKPGFYRRVTTKLVLWTTNFLSRNLFTRGEISRIPSIHFASWTLIDGGTRMFFQSNFDGSWDSYLGDFIDKAAFGLNAFLSNCVGFPRTRFLFLDGVKDVEHYKAWARRANVSTQAWYTAYPGLDVKNVNSNSRVRLGLLQPMNEAQAAEWLREL